MSKLRHLIIIIVFCDQFWSQVKRVVRAHGGGRLNTIFLTIIKNAYLRLYNPVFGGMIENNLSTPAGVRRHCVGK